MKNTLFLRFIPVLLAFTAYSAIHAQWRPPGTVIPPDRKPGQIVDSIDGVYVYHNGSGKNRLGMNYTEDGYNMGIKWICSEFVRRYYWLHYGHKFPPRFNGLPFTAGKNYDPNIPEGGLNPNPNLLQFANPGSFKPQKGDIMFYPKSPDNPDGNSHVSIVSEVGDGWVEIIQQNYGQNGSPRMRFKLTQTEDGKWFIDSKRIKSWLRMPEGGPIPPDDNRYKNVRPRPDSLKRPHGMVTDNLDGVEVYHNVPSPGTPAEIAVASRGYVLGPKYSSEEFVRRYYLEKFKHRMPSQGMSAWEYFDRGLPEGAVNPSSGLAQYPLPSKLEIKKGDVVVYSKSPREPNGMLAIVAEAGADSVVLVRQGYIPRDMPRVKAGYIRNTDGTWVFSDLLIEGWLRMPK